jgi:hypothetical protein
MPSYPVIQPILSPLLYIQDIHLRSRKVVNPTSPIIVEQDDGDKVVKSDNPTSPIILEQDDEEKVVESNDPIDNPSLVEQSISPEQSNPHSLVS